MSLWWWYALDADTSPCFVQFPQPRVSGNGWDHGSHGFDQSLLQPCGPESPKNRPWTRSVSPHTHTHIALALLANDEQNYVMFELAGCEKWSWLFHNDAVIIVGNPILNCHIFLTKQQLGNKHEYLPNMWDWLRFKNCDNPTHQSEFWQPDNPKKLLYP